jgi:hypothetical protein
MDEGAEALAKAFAYNSTIKTLILSSGQIGWQVFLRSKCNRHAKGHLASKMLIPVCWQERRCSMGAGARTKYCFDKA